MARAAPDIKDIIEDAIKTRELSGSFKIKKLLKILAAIRKTALKKKNETRNLAIITLFLLMAAMISLAFTDRIPEIPISVWGLSALMLLVTILSHYTNWTRHINKNVSQLFLPFLDTIKEDISPEQKIYINLPLVIIFKPDLAQPSNITVKKDYLRNYFDFRAHLRDGNTISLTGREIVSVRSRTKTSESGRIKTKIKYKKRDYLKMCLFFNSNRYSVVENFSEPPYSNFKVKIRHEESTDKEFVYISFSDKSKSLDFPSESLLLQPSPKLLVNRLIKLYKVLEIKERK